jgi:uncharacterized protein
MPTILLLLASNIFMTFAWYGHLGKGKTPMWIAILVSWGIAFFEYCFQVPANRLGSERFGGPFNTAQLKTIQEIITLAVFCGFSALYLKEPIRWNHVAAFGLIVIAAFLMFKSPGPTGEVAVH